MGIQAFRMVKARAKSIHMELALESSSDTPRPMSSPPAASPRSSSLTFNKENVRRCQTPSVAAAVRHYRSMLDVDPAPTIGLCNAATAQEFYSDTVDAVVNQTTRKKKRPSSPSEQLAMVQGNSKPGAVRPPGHMQPLNR